MKLNIIRLVLTCFVLMFGSGVHAAISCSVSSSGFTAAYVPANAAINITQTSFTVTCSRGSLSDPTTQTYNVKVNNGLNPSGSGNRAKLNSGFIKYDIYTNSTCSIEWKGTTSLPTAGGTMTLSGLTPTSVTTSYWGCIPAGQTGLATGTYTDTVSMTLTASSAVVTNNTFPVSIFSPAVCNISAAPSNISFGTYNAYGAGVAASTSFGATCTSKLPYTMSLDANTNVVSGLQYSLRLNNSNSGGTNTLNSTGIGSQQTFFINGSMPAGQVGACATGSCTNSNPHTLTITY